jgi:hypothetical protein
MSVIFITPGGCRAGTFEFTSNLQPGMLPGIASESSGVYIVARPGKPKQVDP